MILECILGQSECVDWIHLALVRDQWLAVVNTVMNLGLHERWGVS